MTIFNLPTGGGSGSGKKADVKLGGVHLAATDPVIWRLITGTAPYITTFTVHKDAWENSLKGRAGEPLTLEIQGTAGRQKIKDITILHTVPSRSPNRVSFLAADKRWKWSYKLVTRDYNMIRKSGDRTLLAKKVPFETAITIDQYDFKEYSLKDETTRWEARDIVTDILDELTDGDGAGYAVDSWPMKDDELAIQNLMIRDSGPGALSRALSMIPGANVYVDTQGKVRVFNTTALDEAEEYLKNLPPSTWSGDAENKVHRASIRPGKVRVHYVREVEALFEYIDDYQSGTGFLPGTKDEAYLENVIPTSDPQTGPVEIFNHFDYTFETVSGVASGTWLNADSWLVAMEEDPDKPDGAAPFTWDTVKHHWIRGDLDMIWGGAGSRGVADKDPLGNWVSKVQAFKTHFRQTFRINPIYMGRIRDIKAFRVALLDPVTGAKATAAVWGEHCVIPSRKGERVLSRTDSTRSAQWRRYSTLPDTGVSVDAKAPSPAKVSFIDRDQGIFRIEWIASPFGTVQTMLPCDVTDVPRKNLADQDTKPMGAAMSFGPFGAGRPGCFLADQMELKVMLTIVPGAPNNETQFHVEEVEASAVTGMFRGGFNVGGGKGPDMDVFVYPGELTARFAWGKYRATSDETCRQTLKALLGVGDETLPPGTRELNGFTWGNEEREIVPHAKAYAAEILTPYADTIEGQVVTRMDSKSIELKGNIGSAGISVDTAPSAAVRMIHEFTGEPQPISRAAFLSDEAQKWILGIVPFKPDV